MRDVFLTLIFLGFLPLSAIAPYTGVLVWTWLSVMNPHRLVFGFAYTFQFNAIIAALTLGAWLVSREQKRIPLNATTVLILLFTAWFTLTTVFAFVPDRAWIQWDRNFKTQMLVVLVLILMDRRERIHAMLWVIVLSIGYYAVKGGLFTIATGGVSRVLGPPLSMIGDNNHIALAMVMTLPFIVYLRSYSENALVRLGLGGMLGLTIVGILGTYSRGGFVALSITLGYFWLKSRHKVLILVCGVLVLVPAIQMMPDSWAARMSSTKEASKDESFMGRIGSWHNHAAIAFARPILAGGFEAAYEQSVVDQFEGGYEARAAHSIYFQVLGEQGFVGLALFLGILASAWANTYWTLRRCRRAKEQGQDTDWAADLTRMIQVSLVGYMIGGALLSLAYWDVVYLIVVVSVRLRMIVTEMTADAEARVAAQRRVRARMASTAPQMDRAGFPGGPVS